MIRNKNIWITGASSGIGSELALQLAEAGNTVVASARSIDKLTALSARSESMDGTIVPMAYEATQDKEVDTIRVELASIVGTLDMVIICAGRCEYIDNAELDIDLFRRVYDVNLFGSVNSMTVALPLLKKAGIARKSKPQIVAVASLSAITGMPRAEAYGSSKAAMIYLFNSLRLDLKKTIDVTVVNPGFVATKMVEQNDFPMPFIMSPAEAAGRIIKGVEKRKLTVNFPLRLWLSLKIPSVIPFIWYRWVGPRLVRSS